MSTWEEWMAEKAAVRLAAQRAAEWAVAPEFYSLPIGPPSPRPDNWCVVCWEDYQWPSWYYWDGDPKTAWRPGHRVMPGRWNPDDVPYPGLAEHVDDEFMCHCPCHREPAFAAVIAIG